MGGIKEKILSAHTVGITKVCEECRKSFGRSVWEGNEDRLGEEEVVIRMCLREGVLYRLRAGCE